MNLEETVQQELNGLIEAGTIQTIIKDQLTKTITEIFSSSMRTYSDFGKELEKVVQKSLNIDFTQVSVLQYQQIVTDILNDHLSSNIQTHVSAPIRDSIKQLLSPLDNRPYKLSEIVLMFKKLEIEEPDGELTLIVSVSDYGSTHVSIDREASKSEYNCEVRFSCNKEGIIYSFEVEKYGRKENHKNLTKRTSPDGFHAFIFNLYAQKCPIINDEDDCETEWYND